MENDVPPSLDDAIAWVMTRFDEGHVVDVDSATERFPQFADDLRNFFTVEKRVHHLAMDGLPRQLSEKFSHYELMEVLGRGSFGEVRRAWDLRAKREVAIKVPRSASTDRDSTRRFLREARTASKLSHAYIVTLHEIGEHDSIPYIASELVEGVRLRDWKNRPLEPTEAVAMVAKIAEGLDHAHNNGVIHRDLNPKNILVDKADNPRILDFGLAKLISGTETVTISGNVLGTPAYVSPEQISGLGHDVDGRTDIYALGVIFFELLTGERPFGGSMKMLLHRIEHEQAPNPCELNPDLPPALGAICRRCLANSPDARFPSAKDLLNELRDFIADPDARKHVQQPTVSPARFWSPRRIAGTLARVFSASQWNKSTRADSDVKASGVRDDES